MSQHSFVFIGGLHRSGTTLFHDCLADHPEISGLSDTGVPMNEGHFLQSVYPPAGTKRSLWPIRYLSPVAPDFVSARGYGGPGRFGFDPGSFLDESSPKATERNAERIFRSWAPYWDLARPVLAEKSPPNLVRTRFLQQLFPNSYFIILYRHPVPVSYATRRWTKVRPLYHLFKHWLVCNERFEADRPRLRRVIRLRYEDFVTDPEQILEEVYRFLDLEPVPLKRGVETSINVEYFRRWNDALRRSAVYARYAEFLKARFEARFHRFGYTLGDADLAGVRGGLLPLSPGEGWVGTDLPAVVGP